MIEPKRNCLWLVVDTGHDYTESQLLQFGAGAMLLSIIIDIIANDVCMRTKRPYSTCSQELLTQASSIFTV